MSGDLKEPTLLVVAHKDIADILTSELCGYGPLSDLKVSMIDADQSGNFFNIHLEPQPKKEPTA